MQLNNIKTLIVAIVSLSLSQVTKNSSSPKSILRNISTSMTKKSNIVYMRNTSSNEEWSDNYSTSNSCNKVNNKLW